MTTTITLLDSATFGTGHSEGGDPRPTPWLTGTVTIVVTGNLFVPLNIETFHHNTSWEVALTINAPGTYTFTEGGANGIRGALVGINKQDQSSTPSPVTVTASF